MNDTDNPHPAPTDARAGVLTAEQIAEIRRNTFPYYHNPVSAPLSSRAMILLHYDWDRIIASHRALTAQLRAAEERERTLASCLDDALDMIEDQFPAPDPYTQSIVGPGRAALAASSQRAGDEGEKQDG